MCIRWFDGDIPEVHAIKWINDKEHDDEGVESWYWHIIYRPYQRSLVWHWRLKYCVYNGR